MEEVNNFIAVFDKIIQEKDSFNTAPKVNGALIALSTVVDKLSNFPGEVVIDHSKLVEYSKFLGEIVKTDSNCCSNIQKVISKSLLPSELTGCKSVKEVIKVLEEQKTVSAVSRFKIFEYNQICISPLAWCNLGSFDQWYDGIFKKQSDSSKDVPLSQRFEEDSYINLLMKFYNLLSKFFDLLNEKLHCTFTKEERICKSNVINLVKVQSRITHELWVSIYCITTEFMLETRKSKYPYLASMNHDDVYKLFSVSESIEDYSEQ